MHNAAIMHDIGLEETTNLIAHTGHFNTVVAQGHMGTGKSSMLKALQERFPNHHACYFDCTTKDLGDLMLPKLKDLEGSDYVRFATNEELGLHLQDRPIILMVDEYGKANPAVKLGLLRLMLERELGGYKLHPESIVFATTNLGAEGVGDLLPPHACNRLDIVRLRKPTAIEWVEWGINNGINSAVLGFAKDFPQIFQSFEEIDNPDDNDYIFHPRATGRTAFVTPRSLERAARILDVRNHMTDRTVTAALIGIVGPRAAMDMAAYVNFIDQLPTTDSIVANPEKAKVPESAAAVCMVVFRTLAMIEEDWIDPWMVYLKRLNAEAAGLFANGVRAPRYRRQGEVMTNQSFTTWAREHGYLFAADKR